MLITARFPPLHLDRFVPLRKSKAALKLIEWVVWQLLCINDTVKQPEHPRVGGGQGGRLGGLTSACKKHLPGSIQPILTRIQAVLHLPVFAYGLQRHGMLGHLSFYTAEVAKRDPAAEFYFETHPKVWECGGFFLLRCFFPCLASHPGWVDESATA